MKAQSFFCRFFKILFLLLLGNVTILYSVWQDSFIWKLLLCILGGIVFLIVLCVHPHTMGGEKRLASLAHGCSLLRSSMAWFWTEVLIVLLLALWSPCELAVQLCNGGVFLLLYGTFVCIGVLQIALHAKQVKLPWYIALFFWWWVPVCNSILIRHIYRTAQRELHFECAKAEQNKARKENEICKTKYPILLVHGIFFRDWQYFNYWGRIPGELIRNGAVVFYGNQQSAQSIENSARELAVQIRTICEKTGAEKVNVIAHSKGGLDCRCAIQDFGAAPYVASLTTINTPHHGCTFVDDLLEKMPSGIVQWLARRYNGVFSKLGDIHPDFLQGVQELTVKNCSEFHRTHPCTDSVAYLAVMSKMHNARSAPFPLWLGYLLNRKRDGENDGLVPVASARLENAPFYLIPEPKKRGISHGDMIDLMRENISGFDVREWYSQLVQQLKRNGF